MVYVLPIRRERFYNEDDGDLIDLTYYPTHVSNDQLLSDHPYIKPDYKGFKPKRCGIKYEKDWTIVCYIEQVGKECEKCSEVYFDKECEKCRKV